MPSIGSLVPMLAALSWQTAPPAHDGSARPAPTPAPDIVVEARSQNALDRFVDQMTDHLNGKQVARWNHRICPRVLGLDAAHATFLIDRLAAAARAIGIGTVRSKCSADVVIVVTSDAEGFTRGFIKRYPLLFQDLSNGIGVLASVKATLLKARPVRWLNASSTGSAGGGKLLEGTNRVYSASRINAAIQENAVLSLAIVDGSNIADVSWGQLGDYLAMVSLARPDMRVRYDDMSILPLFTQRDAGRKAPDGLTATDSAFLKALYGVAANAPAGQARQHIKSALRHGDR